jgi:prepilin-type N-terminal cleavage/methylation domain-containing protein
MPNIAPNRCLHRTAAGFTLIELMVTVAIVAVISAFAIPAYTDYIKRGRLVDGTNALAACRVTMEQYFQDNRTYVNGACSTSKSSDGLFSLTTSGLSATGYTVTGEGSGQVASFKYTINEKGVTATTGLPTGWGSTCTTAWIVRKGQTCPS